METQETPSMKNPWILVERIGYILGLLALAFAAGANWHRIDALEQDQKEVHRVVDKEMQDTKDIYARKDVVMSQLETIQYQLNELKSLLQSRNTRSDDTKAPYFRSEK